MYDGYDDVVRHRKEMRPEVRPVAALEMIADQMAGIREELRCIRVALEAEPRDGRSGARAA
jgi:hypothetical protein